MTPTSRGLTVAEVARRFRVSPDRVRAWIKRGELAAINTRDVRSGRPRFVILPEALAAFEQGRSVAPPPKPRRRKKTGMVDYYPDEAVA
jgi:excisionase family DNA binding protein